jgi:hypothetical protein
MTIVWIIWKGKGWQVALATFLCSYYITSFKQLTNSYF